jgi:hypothetical protein
VKSGVKGAFAAGIWCRAGLAPARCGGLRVFSAGCRGSSRAEKGRVALGEWRVESGEWSEGLVCRRDSVQGRRLPRPPVLASPCSRQVTVFEITGSPCSLQVAVFVIGTLASRQIPA